MIISVIFCAHIQSTGGGAINLICSSQDLSRCTKNLIWRMALFLLEQSRTSTIRHPRGISARQRSILSMSGWYICLLSSWSA
uniref:Uncharacterized protein n=1 Tax=Anguilla anguilla TaxID=7936 RepID=A0A0E9X3S7_ANGAN